MRGSHRWVAEEIAAREPAGVRHQDLNSWAIRTVTEASARGQLPLAYEVEAINDEQNPNRRLGVIEQVVGRAGSVVGGGGFLSTPSSVSLVERPMQEEELTWTH